MLAKGNALSGRRCRLSRGRKAAHNVPPRIDLGTLCAVPDLVPERRAGYLALLPVWRDVWTYMLAAQPSKRKSDE